MATKTLPNAPRQNRRTVIVGLLTATLLIAIGHRGESCNTLITWRADLTSVQPALPTAPKPKAHAQYVFDFANEAATVLVDAPDVPGITAIELHTGLASPAIFVLYSAADGPFPGHLTRRISPADLHPQADAHVQTFADFTHVAAAGGAYIVVCTAAHPSGELRGQFSMHKELVFSTSGTLHDPRLHQQADASAPPSPSPAAGKP